MEGCYDDGTYLGRPISRTGGGRGGGEKGKREPPLPHEVWKPLKKLLCKALETPFLSLYHRQNGTRTSMSPQSMHASRILYWVHTIQTSKLFGPTARSAVAPSNALENLFLSLETHIKVLKNGTESNVSKSLQDVQISTRFLVIPRESWKL